MCRNTIRQSASRSRAASKELLGRREPFAKALISNDEVILETNEAWNRIFQSNPEKFKGKRINNFPYFDNNEIKKMIDSSKSHILQQTSNPIYIEDIDKLITIDLYPITDTKGAITKIVCNIEDVTDRLKKDESDKELEIQKDTLKSFFQNIRML